MLVAAVGDMAWQKILSKIYQSNTLLCLFVQHVLGTWAWLSSVMFKVTGRPSKNLSQQLSKMLRTNVVIFVSATKCYWWFLVRHLSPTFVGTCQQVITQNSIILNKDVSNEWSSHKSPRLMIVWITTSSSIMQSNVSLLPSLVKICLLLRSQSLHEKNGRAPWKNRIYWYISFFCPSLNRVLFPMFCLLVEGKRQILVF